MKTRAWPFSPGFSKKRESRKEHEASPGRSSISSVIPGTGERGRILLDHIDVVPARADEWSVDPFRLKSKTVIYGREPWT